MERQWTDAQREAINTKGSNLLLAAAAGSGKTAVLVERIIKMVTDEQNPVDADKLLVLTFTKSAASEMRDRILDALTEKLKENPQSQNLARQLILAQKASITTIHSFCNELIRTNFNLADVDPSFRIADTTENELLRAQALSEAVDEMYEDEEFFDSFAQFTMCYSKAKNDYAIYELVDSIYSFCMSLPDPFGWLRESCEKLNADTHASFDETDWAEIIVSYFKSKIEKILFEYDFCIKKANEDEGKEVLGKFLSDEKAQFEDMQNVNTYSSLREMAEKAVFDTFPPKPKGTNPIYREMIKDLRDKAKGNFLSMAKSIFNLSCDEQIEVSKKMYPLMRALSGAVQRFAKRFDEKKEKKNILNFNDLEHKAYRLLVDKEGHATPLAESVKNKYHEILIDEYQDISRLQEAIFETIKRDNNLFMVGDLKQSIYRFRNTDPILFKQKKALFEDLEGAKDRKIILSKNFRSRSHILDGINFIFERIMSDSVGEIEYNDEEKLYFGADYIEDDALALELNIIDTKEINSAEDSDTIESITAEACLAAKKISELFKNNTMVKGKDGLRKITYKDICILVRAPKDRATVFASILNEAGIPCYSDKSGSLLESIEIETIMAYLRIIDNPHQDIPLLSVLRSDIYRFTTNDLAKIRVKDRKVTFYEAMQKKAEDKDDTAKATKAFLDELDGFRKQAEFLSVSELIWHIYMQTGFYDCQLARNSGEMRQRNLRALYLRAGEYEKTGVKGLYGFINFIDEYSGGGGRFDASRDIGEEHDVVRIMSIHKSKGLEFPVVLLCNMGKQFDKRDLRKSVLFHPEVGYGPKFVDLSMGITYPNGIRTAVSIKKELELISEEMRILYVALTRAKERLIIIGAASRGVESLVNKYAILASDSKKIERFKAEEAQSCLEWFVAALINHPDGDALRERTGESVSVIEDKSRWKINIYKSAEELLNKHIEEEKPVIEEKIDVSKILKNVMWEYPYKKDIFVPTKISVTEFKRKQYENREMPCVYLYDSKETENREMLSAKERGTAIHKVMEMLDFKANVSTEDVKNKISELLKGGILTSSEAETIDAEKIAKFFESDAGALIKKAEKIEKEVMFAINIDAGEVIGDYTGEEKVMLQGIIDCVLFCGDGIYIIDYKTDKVREVSQIVSKYKIQLDLYARAAEIIYKKCVRKKILYLFDKNKSVEI
ncbi:MAG: helicase-exonuclease AddAB subunit AddA [Ruminococcaceae bacterium]|nr:helicase-exonuclease AddAB subunit AddA [Oscillospiraceae bacterium]